MFFSRVRLLNTEKALNEFTTKMWGENLYSIHQLIWTLFPDKKDRDFVFRQEEDRSSTLKKPLFYIVSKDKPKQAHDFFTVETKNYQPVLNEGQRFQFSLRANPVVRALKGSQAGKHHDVVMHFKQMNQGKNLAGLQGRLDDVTVNWLKRKSIEHGFSFETQHINRGKCLKDVYHQHEFSKKKGGFPIKISTLDYSGELQVTDANKFEQALYKGIGRAKGFGCGLLMIKP